MKKSISFLSHEAWLPTSNSITSSIHSNCLISSITKPIWRMIIAFFFAGLISRVIALHLETLLILFRSQLPLLHCLIWHVDLICLLDKHATGAKRTRSYPSMKRILYRVQYRLVFYQRFWHLFEPCMVRCIYLRDMTEQCKKVGKNKGESGHCKEFHWLSYIAFSGLLY